MSSAGQMASNSVRTSCAADSERMRAAMAFTHGVIFLILGAPAAANLTKPRPLALRRAAGAWGWGTAISASDIVDCHHVTDVAARTLTYHAPATSVVYL